MHRASGRSAKSAVMAAHLSDVSAEAVRIAESTRKMVSCSQKATRMLLRCLALIHGN